MEEEAGFFSIRGQSLHDLEAKYGMLQQKCQLFLMRKIKGTKILTETRKLK